MAEAEGKPDIWILWWRRTGDLEQMQTLAKALGWPVTVKRLSFLPPEIPALAPFLLRRRSDTLHPPWPRLVLCAEALPSIIARRLRRRSRGAIKAVCIGRPAGAPAEFDLVVTTAQYRLPDAPNIVELSMPLLASSCGGEAAAAPRTGSPEHPLIAVAIGAASDPDQLDAGVVQKLLTDARQYADQQHGTLAVLTSPRTEAGVREALIHAIAPPHTVHVYDAARDNPYRKTLAAADQIIVTSDSVSMVGDALETGKPVFVYPLPQARSLRWRLMEWLHRHAVVERAPWLRPAKWLFDAGVMEANADRRLLFGRLVAERRLAWFGSAPPMPQPSTARQDAEAACARLRELLAAR